MTSEYQDEANPFEVSAEELADMVHDKQLQTLSDPGGLHGLEKGLRTNLQAGILNDEDLFPDFPGYGTISRRNR
jgi:hypothetical protein